MGLFLSLIVCYHLSVTNQQIFYLSLALSFTIFSMDWKKNTDEPQKTKIRKNRLKIVRKGKIMNYGNTFWAGEWKTY